jgi:CubicO group peptidase (beta-lactamase class C family)
MPLKSDLSNLQAYTEQAIRTHKIPALSIAIWKGGKLTQAASGVLNLNTGVKATTDSLFQIGSITKVMTTSLIMQLVDEGKVDLDAPVKNYLHDFLLADTEAANRISVRHLLNHTSGIAGDYWPNDEGHEGNLIARYVDRCSQLPVIHPVGAMYSYTNTAFGIAGRLIEVVRGMPWSQVMKRYLYQPLGMKHAIADPSDLLRFRAAIGHVHDGNDERWVFQKKLISP